MSVSDAKGHSLKTAKIGGQISGDSWDIAGAVNCIKALSTQAGWQFAAQGFVKTLDATQGLAGIISALWFGKVSTKGDLSVGLIAQGADTKGIGLNKLTVGGRIVNSSIFTPNGSVSTFMAGVMQNSTCFVGTVIGSDSNGDGVDDLPDPATDIVLGPNQPEIKRLSIKGIKGDAGDCFFNSSIAAANMGTVSLVRPQYENAVVPFGLATDYIRKLTITDNDGKRAFKNLGAPADSWQQFDFGIDLA